MRKPIVGEELYLVTNNYYNRFSDNNNANVVKVTKVGRKYFSINWIVKVKHNLEIQFSIKSWKEDTNYTSDYTLYESEQHYLDEKEYRLYENILKNSFNYTGYNSKNYTLQQLKDVAKILDINIKKEN